MEIRQALLADTAHVRPDGAVDVVGLRTQITGPDYPHTLSGVLVLVLGIEPGEPGASLLVRVRLRDVRDRVVLASRDEVVTIPAEMQPTAAGLALHVLIRIGEMVLPRASIYELVVELEGQEAAYVGLRAFRGRADPGRMN